MRIKIDNPFDFDVAGALAIALNKVVLPTDSIEFYVGSEDYVHATRERAVIKVRYTKFLVDERVNYIALLVQMAREEILRDFNEIDNDFVRYIVDEYFAAKSVDFDLYSFAYRMALEESYTLFDYMKVRVIAELIPEKERILKMFRNEKYEKIAVEMLSYLPKGVRELVRYAKNLKIR